MRAMADSRPQTPTSIPVLEYRLPQSSRPPTLTHLGGSFGFAGCCVGLLVLLVACAGYGAAVRFSMVPVGLGTTGILLSLSGGIIERKRLPEDTAVLAAVFAGVLSLLGGFMEMSVWLGWR